MIQVGCTKLGTSKGIESDTSHDETRNSISVSTKLQWDGPIPSHDFPFSHHENSQNGENRLLPTPLPDLRMLQVCHHAGKRVLPLFAQPKPLLTSFKKTKSIQDWMLLGTFGRGPE